MATAAADQDTAIIADGLSCREQIRQLTHRKALRLAEVIDMAFQANRQPVREDVLAGGRS